MTDETGFFALLSRMRYISRWGLMRSSIPENIQEHSHETAVFAHALGLIRSEILGAPCDPERLAVLALYHDASEILTGDLPTPIKYHDGAIRTAYKDVERLAEERLISMLPEKLRGAYRASIRPVSGDEERLAPPRLRGPAARREREGAARSGQGRRQALGLPQVRRGAQGRQPGVPLRRKADPRRADRHGTAGGRLVHGQLPSRL